MNIKVTYDRKANAVYIYLIENRQSVMSKELGDFVLDFDEDSKLIGFEILNASRWLSPGILSGAEQV